MGRVVLVCGGRDFGHVMKKGLTHEQRVEARRQRVFMRDQLNRLHSEDQIVRLIHGRATGADQYAGGWASARLIQVRSYPAKWHDLNTPGAVIRTNSLGHRYNARAGDHRNTLMLDENPDIDLVVAFPGGNGTADMVAQAEARGIQVKLISLGAYDACHSDC